ncbi:phage terminase small subunit [Glutamicibacter sp. AOP3-A1-12]|uniref:phage terminase small subunit n=1 Tax=Glutamicibacter sp. AOP3-A1-12 TaxID=3457701 RepID=UPI004034F4BB
MAGRGPAPTGRGGRGSGRGSANMRIITAEPVEQPGLPDFDVQIEIDGEMTYQSFDWPARTREWWQMWADSPLADEFTSTDWSELMDTALLHAKFWSGDTKLAGELRLRVAKFGATPEDRARLKIQFAAADEAEDRKERRRSGVRKPDGDDPRLKLMG